MVLLSCGSVALRPSCPHSEGTSPRPDLSEVAADILLFLGQPRWQLVVMGSQKNITSCPRLLQKRRRASIQPLNGSIISQALLSDDGGWKENRIGYLYWTQSTTDFSLLSRMVPFNTKSLRNIRKPFLKPFFFFPWICRYLHQSKDNLCQGKDFCFHPLLSEITCSSMNKWCVFQEMKHSVVCLARREECFAVDYVLLGHVAIWPVRKWRPFILHAISD